MLNSFCVERQVRISAMMEWSFAKDDSTSSAVEYWPVLVFLGLSTNLSLSNKMCPNCLGEAKLNSSPAASKIWACKRTLSSSRVTAKFVKKGTSKLIPSCSIAESTGSNGSSTVRNNSWFSAAVNSFSKCCFNCQIMSASSTAYWVWSFKETSRIEPWFFPFLPIKSVMGWGS